jgi:alpha/beta superfamily hydrolase
MARREEKGTTIPWLGEAGEQGEVLDGLFVAGLTPSSGGALVAPPHPLYGGSMGSPVVSELAWACQKAGMASLRFDWRGVGASTGAASGELEDGVRDFAAALLHLGRSVAGPLVACGYSFGAASAARAIAGQPRVTRVVLVAPPPALLALDALREGDRQVLLIGGEHDALAPAERLEAIAGELPRARFARVPEADHFFAAGLARLGGLVTDWLAE